MANPAKQRLIYLANCKILCSKGIKDKAPKEKE
jgi:hypothetical protein